MSITIARAALALLGTITLAASCGREEPTTAIDRAPTAASIEPPAGTPQKPTRLFLAGVGKVTVVEVEGATSRVVRLPELRAGDPPYWLVRRGERLVFYGGDTYAVDRDLDSPAEKLGESWFFVPSADPERVWLAVLDPESPETVRALHAVREMTVDGRTTARGAPPPDGAWPAVGVAGGLVYATREGTLLVWDPERRAIVQTLPGIETGSAHGQRVATCDERSLYVTDVGTGIQQSFSLPEGFAAFECRASAFSPDGRLLALPIMTELGHDAARALALVDLDHRRLATVPGSTVDPGYVFVAWAESGASVFITGGERFERRSILEYRLGSERAEPVRVDVGDFYGMAAS